MRPARRPPEKRCTLLISDLGKTGHLQLVLTDPCATVRFFSCHFARSAECLGESCLIGVGYHRFIKHPSYIMYARLAAYDAAYIAEQVEKNIVDFEGMLAERVFSLMSADVVESSFSAPLLQMNYQQNR